MDTEQKFWTSTVFVLGIVVCVLGFYVARCSQAIETERLKTVQECLKKSKNTLECRHVINQRDYGVGR